MNEWMSVSGFLRFFHAKNTCINLKMMSGKERKEEQAAAHCLF